MSPTCEFCLKFGPNRRPERVEWFDAELATSGDGLVVIPGVGAPYPGYVLVVSRHHYESFLSSPLSMRARGDVLLDDVMATLTAIYGPVVAFEHGTGGELEARAGPCIDHAHIHVLPLALDLLSRFAEDYPDMIVVQRMSDVHIDAHSREYLSLNDSSGVGWKVAFSPKPRPGSQYFRKRVFELLGRYDEHDYALYPHEENIRKTVADFRLVIRRRTLE